MAFISRTQLFAAVLFFSLLSQIAGHSYMTKPISRSNQAQTQTGCRGPSCLGPCDAPLSRINRAPIVAARGDSITVEWPRNNHAGGFIRFAWAPTSQSDSHAAFDSHIQQINCHEIGNPTAGQCAPADPIRDPNGGGSGPGDGSFGACNVAIKVPLDLADGKWTLQWAWFGGAFSLGDYFSCADYNIAGGPSGSLTPVFIGGDFSYPGQQKCKFFNTDKLHVCTNEPCQAPIFTASQMQSGPPAAGQLGNITATITVPVPVVVPVTVPVTISVASPAAPITTAAAVQPKPASPSTTGAARPITTSSMPVKPAPVPVNVPVTVPVMSTPSSNCAAASIVSSSTASVTSVDVWTTGFHATVAINSQEAILANWVLEVKFPERFSSTVLSFFNGGLLQCEDKNTAYFVPMASWANNVPSGSTVTVEFIATNNGMDAKYIKDNMQLRVLKR